MLVYCRKARDRSLPKLPGSYATPGRRSPKALSCLPGARPREPGLGWVGFFVEASEKVGGETYIPKTQ